MVKRWATVLSALLAFACGCGNRTEVFDINLVNATAKPVTISLAKDAGGAEPGPYEPLWATPEDKAWESPRADEQWSLDVVPPGGKRSLDKFKGTFDARTRGVFRAYWGDLTISEMLAKSRGSPDRVDIPLVPGRNDITLIQREGHLAAQVDQPAPKR